MWIKHACLNISKYIVSSVTISKVEQTGADFR